MNMEFMLVVISFAALFSCSKELPIVGSTLPPEPMPIEHPHGTHYITGDKSKVGNSEEIKDDGFDYPFDRSNYSRQLTLSSTKGYDEWWFLTTRRPQLSLKDFPGRPGVATWKEISPSSSGENRKSRKMNGPTAAGVSSASWSSSLHSHLTQAISTVLCMVFLISCSCWT